MDDLFSYARRRAEQRMRARERDSSMASAPAVGRAPDRHDEAVSETQDPPLTVSQANSRAQHLLENSLGAIRVVGELSGIRCVGGHWYFALKDRRSRLPAVLFKRAARSLRFELREGIELIAYGRLSVYGPSGRYQLLVDRLEALGAGALQAEFEALKRRLQAEGLFDAGRKRALPLVPARVAVVTSASGAVIRDIIHVATRRFPRADILLVPSAVQGPAAAPSIARALDRIAECGESLRVDVVIVARGGGSLEDLWGYNVEQVARALAMCPVPVVSAVGHETDFTIADFVADVRAATPSAAAELVFPRASDLHATLRRFRDTSRRSLLGHLLRERQRTEALRYRLGDARRALRESSQSLVERGRRVDRAVRARLYEARALLGSLERRLADGHPRVGHRLARVELEAVFRRAQVAWKRVMEKHRHHLGNRAASLHALSPLAVLERGYAIALDEAGVAVRDGSQVALGSTVEVRLYRGRFSARVIERDLDPVRPCGESCQGDE